MWPSNSTENSGKPGTRVAIRPNTTFVGLERPFRRLELAEDYFPIVSMSFESPDGRVLLVISRRFHDLRVALSPGVPVVSFFDDF